MKAKKSIIFLFTLYCGLFVSILGATEEVSSDKFYLSKEAIELTDQGICVLLGSEQIVLNSIHHDENGYYITGEELIQKGDMWYCYKCHDYHPGGWNHCPKK